jgi:hypothetical protein
VHLSQPSQLQPILGQLEYTMASLMGSLRAPQCLPCMRRVNASFNDAWLASAQQQVRGKKKLVKQTTIKVRLLRDVTRYGKQGMNYSRDVAVGAVQLTIRRIRHPSPCRAHAQRVLPKENGRVYDKCSNQGVGTGKHVIGERLYFWTYSARKCEGPGARGASTWENNSS